MKYSKPTLSDVESAFCKLQANVYFDNYDLILRGKVAEFKRDLNSNLGQFLAEIHSKEPFQSLFASKIELTILPKKVEVKSVGNSSNFYTNVAPIVGNRILKPAIHCDFPVAFHLISTIWLMRYGASVDSRLSDGSFGNRLSTTTDNTISEGRSLFKPYFGQFQKWWSLAIKKTKETLQSNENVTIVNLDLKSFYHEVNFDFSKLERYLVSKYPGLLKDPIHLLLKKIHLEYSLKLSEIRKQPNKHPQNTPLPIGLFTSHLFANYHLKSLDRFITKKFKPIFYGRYVDDVLIVLKNTVLSESKIKKELGKDPNAVVRAYLSSFFSELFDQSEDSSEITFKLPSVKNLQLNLDKLFIYQFDHKHTPNLIDKFVEEQKERGSMFRFLSDEEDDNFDDFDSQTFESNFEEIEVNKARFKHIEDNKYKLSVYLSKLIRRRIQRGEGYKDDEVDKILKYFQGGYLVKHYFFWEKLFTLLVVYKRKNSLTRVLTDIFKEIEKIKVISLDSDEFEVGVSDYRKSMLKLLEKSLAMSLGLNLTLLEGRSQELTELMGHVANE